jgi:phosphonate transport system substrate-binding protein
LTIAINGRPGRFPQICQVCLFIPGNIMRLIHLLLILLVFTGCARRPSEDVIRLNQLEPLTPAAEPGVVPLRIAVAAVISPKGTVESYTPLLDYLSQRLQRPVELVQRRTYREINDLLAANQVDLAFVCTSAYIVGAREFGMELLVAPQVKGDTVYHSLLLVPDNSPARSMADLRGGVFAFTDPISNTGRKYPTSLVQELGDRPETFFSRVFFTYSHDEAILAVANRVADGAAVDSLVYEFAVARDPVLAGKVRIIHRSPPFGIPPVVVSPRLRPQLRAELQTILLEMASDPAGMAALAVLDIDRFVLISDDAYVSARQLELSLNEP